MPSAFRDPKTLPEWIELDYYRRPRGLRRWKRWAGWCTLFLTAAALAVVTFLPRGPRLKMYQAGPVSSAHAMFNNDCAQCHTEAFTTARRFWPGNADVHAVPDEACIKCHDGPPHNPKLLDKDVQACAACHREHRGRVVLARITDDACTHCHADLKDHTRDPAGCRFLNVTGFPDGHPEFALWRKDQARDPVGLHFNHAAHVKSEGVLMPGPDKRTKHLDCADCHQTDAAGRYMQPVRYEQHCRECHPLSIRLTGDVKGRRLEEAARKFAREPAPHREPEVVRAVLRDRLVQLVRQTPVGKGGLDPDELPRAVPGPEHEEPAARLRWRLAHGEPDTAIQRDFVDVQLQQAEHQLFAGDGGCAQCHIRTKAADAASGLPRYAPTRQRQRWLPHSRFSHQRHRMMPCADCHGGAATSRVASDVLMPKVASCAQCHSPAVGARSDCLECHAYHDRCEDRGPGRKRPPPDGEECRRKREGW